MTTWRFDQGRLDYFQIDEIKRIAAALVTVDNIPKPKVQADLLRQALQRYSSLPFAPDTYTVWRNYKRVFGCTMLASEIAGRIICTDLCKVLAAKATDVDVDDYLGHFSRNFYYPSPVFKGYNTNDPQVFPALAIIKFLLSEYLVKNKNHVSLQDIAEYLIANNVTGCEPISFYATLRPRNVNVDLRQVRELVLFISQFSFLKWGNSNLYLEIVDKEEALKIEALFTPNIRARNSDPGAELLNLGSGFQGTSFGDLTIAQVNMVDAEFTEGRKVRVTHLRTERSAKLQDFYFSFVPNPHICDMCTMDTSRVYPWVRHLIELHHLLPLSSPVHVDVRTTSVKDIIGLCPSCHRATHKYYAAWLRTKQTSDFTNYDEARHVYTEVKKEFRAVGKNA